MTRHMNQQPSSVLLAIMLLAVAASAADALVQAWVGGTGTENDLPAVELNVHVTRDGINGTLALKRLGGAD